jgi:hypothetical protein
MCFTIKMLLSSIWTGSRQLVSIRMTQWLAVSNETTSARIERVCSPPPRTHKFYHHNDEHTMPGTDE